MASTSPLTGKALLSKVDQLSRLPRRELARQCGYVTATKTGKQRINLTGFYDAILAAKGMKLDSTSPQDKRGREATYRAKVHQNGQLIVGPAYTQQLGVEPGDEFEIKLGYKHIQLKRIQAESSSANGSATEEIHLDSTEAEDPVAEPPTITPKRGRRKKKA